MEELLDCNLQCSDYFTGAHRLHYLQRRECDCFIVTSNGTFLYAYDNRMCYFDEVIENVLINLYAFMNTNTECNPKNANTFNSAPLHVRIRNTHTLIIRIRK